MEKIVRKLVGGRWRDAYVRECLWCEKEFKAAVTEVKNGDGRFCSQSCGARHSNAQRKLQKLKCQICDKTFYNVKPQTKYCSHSCRRHQKRKNSKRYSADPKNHVYHFSAKIQRQYGKLPCMIKDCGCGWTKEFLEVNNTTCDIHHIIPRRKGGDDSFSNLVLACPNSHRLADKGRISPERIVTLADYVDSLKCDYVCSGKSSVIKEI